MHTEVNMSIDLQVQILTAEEFHLIRYSCSQKPFSTPHLHKNRMNEQKIRKIAQILCLIEASQHYEIKKKKIV